MTLTELKNNGLYFNAQIQRMLRFKKWHQSIATAFLFLKSIRCFHFIVITYQLKIKLSVSFGIWSRANRFFNAKIYHYGSFQRKA